MARVTAPVPSACCSARAGQLRVRRDVTAQLLTPATLSTARAQLHRCWVETALHLPSSSAASDQCRHGALVCEAAVLISRFFWGVAFMCLACNSTRWP